MRKSGTVFAFTIIALSSVVHIAAQERQSEFWDARNLTIERDVGSKPIRIGIWDSGVDTSLFVGRLALGKDGKPIIRGYDPFKLRKDTAMAVLPAWFDGRRDDLNGSMIVDTDANDKVLTDETKAKYKDLIDRTRKLSDEDYKAFVDGVGRWGGYTHGTAVADIAIAGNAHAEIVIARMEWWHGKPPVPCWTKELADREALSIRDLLSFLVKNGARVVNMSWGRFQGSYVRNLEACAPTMKPEERLELARYTVEKIRTELKDGMAAAPNVLFVGASGNDGSTVANANPATRFSAPNFILVGAVDQDGKRRKSTNTGPEVGIYANGFRIPTRLPGGAILASSGTSMATPNVTNAAAKMLAVNRKLTGAQMKSILIETADANDTGDKLLHTAKAVAAARAAGSKRDR
jgi:hypothetical protein